MKHINALFFFLSFTTLKTTTENDLLQKHVLALPGPIQEIIFKQAGLADIFHTIQMYQESDEAFENRLKNVTGSITDGNSDLLYTLKNNNRVFKYSAANLYPTWKIFQTFKDDLNKVFVQKEVCELNQLPPHLIGVSPNKHYFVFCNPYDKREKITLYCRKKHLGTFDIKNLSLKIFEKGKYIHFHVDGIAISSNGKYIALIDLRSAAKPIVDFLIFDGEALIFKSTKYMEKTDYFNINESIPCSFSFNKKGTKVGFCFIKNNKKDVVTMNSPFPVDEKMFTCSTQQELYTYILHKDFINYLKKNDTPRKFR